MPSRRDLLKRVTVFRDLDDGSLASIEKLFVEKRYMKDSVIFGQRDPGDALFVLAEGRVKVSLYGKGGREVILSIFRPGDFFGEMSILDNEPRSASVVAVEDSSLLILERNAFRRHIESNPKIALGVLAEMSRRLRQADSIIGNLALLDVYGRVARYLRDLASKEGEATDGGVAIKQRPTQAEIAAMIGTSRETVSRALSDFQRRGFLEMSGKRIFLRQSFLIEDGQIEAAE